MKKFLITTIIILLIIAVGLYLKMSTMQISGGGHYTYYCDDAGIPGGQLSFWIEKQKDNQFHLIIASKPPQADIVVTKTELGLFNFQYSGNGIDVKDATSSLQVNFNGKQLQNCKKIYPGT